MDLLATILYSGSIIIMNEMLYYLILKLVKKHVIICKKLKSM